METTTDYDFHPDDLAECIPIATALGVAPEQVATAWERYSEENFAGWLTGLEGISPERFLELTGDLA